MRIKAVTAREILDSRGNPTVEADVVLENGTLGRASVPSGASTGSHEAHELRDTASPRYGGKGVGQAVENIKGEIANALIGAPGDDQRALDGALIALDGTPNKSRLGANAVLAVSLAAAKASAAAYGQPLFEYAGQLSRSAKPQCLPLPLCNVINGGKHAAGSTDIQEFMIVPVGARTFADAVRMLAEVFHALRAVLAEAGYGTTVGDEGGYAPAVKGGNREALERIAQAVSRAKYTLGEDFVFALDVAASELVHGPAYRLATEDRELSADAMIEWYAALAKEFPIVSIEDGLGENDWHGWQRLRQAMPETQLVGDDLLVTNVAFLKRGIAEQAANAILVKVNQIGTLSEAIDAVDMAHEAGWHTIISHRSGETEDATIAHLAVGLGCGQIKTGSVSRSDRTAKYNELLRIEEALGGRARFAGKGALAY